MMTPVPAIVKIAVPMEAASTRRIARVPVLPMSVAAARLMLIAVVTAATLFRLIYVPMGSLLTTFAAATALMNAPMVEKGMMPIALVIAPQIAVELVPYWKTAVVTVLAWTLLHYVMVKA